MSELTPYSTFLMQRFVRASVQVGLFLLPQTRKVLIGLSTGAVLSRVPIFSARYDGNGTTGLKSTIASEQKTTE